VHRDFNDIAQEGQVRPEVETLEHHGQPCANALDLGFVGRFLAALPIAFHLDCFAVHRDGTAGGCFQHVDAAQQCGFAGPAGADDGDNVTLISVQGNPLEHFKIAKGFVEVTNFYGLGQVGMT